MSHWGYMITTARKGAGRSFSFWINAKRKGLSPFRPGNKTVANGEAISVILDIKAMVGNLAKFLKIFESLWLAPS